MNMIEVGSENSHTIYLHYQDIGSGKPVVLIHGWPLSHQSWEMQVPELVANGFRVITYCRRGFGHSSKPSSGYDYDTLTDDLHKLITDLELHDATLVGFSMGTGEVARYLSRYGSERVSQAVFISGILPALFKGGDNLDAVEPQVFDNMIASCKKDRFAFLRHFLDDFYSHGLISRSAVSEAVKEFSWSMAIQASPIATIRCIESWAEDFREDARKVMIPCLVIHGTADKITPIEFTGLRLQALLPRCRYVEIEGGPHGVIISHAQEVNSALIGFLKTEARAHRDASLQHH